MASRAVSVIKGDRKPFMVSPKAKVWAYAKPISMACGFPRLLKMVSEELEQDPTNEDLFLFVNKKETYLKILYRSEGGFCLFCKKLDRGRKFGEVPGNLSMLKLTTYVNLITSGK